MKIKNTLILPFSLTLLFGCQNQYTCGYDPDLYKFTDAFSVEYIENSLEVFIENFEKFGIKNKFCIANKSKYEEILKKYSANIQVVSNEVSFHIFGSKGFTLHFQQKANGANKKKEIKLFCDFISKEVDISKITYYEKEGKGKLCDFD